MEYILLITLVVGILLINYRIGKIMQTQLELAQDLVNIKDQLVKVGAEVLAKVAALEAAVAGSGMTSPEVDAAMLDLKAVAQALDDLNPDPVV